LEARGCGRSTQQALLVSARDGCGNRRERFTDRRDVARDMRVAVRVHRVVQRAREEATVQHLLDEQRLQREVVADLEGELAERRNSADMDRERMPVGLLLPAGLDFLAKLIEPFAGVDTRVL